MTTNGKHIFKWDDIGMGRGKNVGDPRLVFYQGETCLACGLINQDSITTTYSFDLIEDKQ